MNGLAPVLTRIAEIHSRFGIAEPPRPLGADVRAEAGANAGAGAGFENVYADAQAAAGAPATASAGTTTWAGVGSNGWVFPDGTPAAPTLLGGGAGVAAPYGVTTGGVVPGGTPFAAEFEAAAARHGVPADLLAAVGYVESRYQTDAVSTAGAQGMMQLMPFVSEHYGVNPFDPVQAIDTGAQILAEHFQRFGSWDLALAAYNAGAGAVANAGNAVPSQRVAGYVAAVNARIEEM